MRVILVCYYFYFLSDLFVRETQKKYFVRREIFFYFFYGTCVFPSLFFEEKKNYKSFCLHCMIFMCYYVYYFGKNLQIIIFIMFWLLKTVICTVHFFVIFRRLVRKFVIKMWYIYVQNEAILWYKNFSYQKFSISCLLNNKTLLFTYDSYYFICVIYLFYALQHFDEKS